MPAHAPSAGSRPPLGSLALWRPRTGPSLSTRTGRRANVVSFALTVLTSLAQAWALICVGRALGSLALPGSTTVLPGLLTQALLAVLVVGGAQLGVEAVSRFSATREEGLLRRRVLAHLLDLGPARAAELRSGATVSQLTDGAERVALYRQTFLAPSAAACLAPALVLALLALTVDPLSAAVLLAAVIAVPATIVAFHSRTRSSSSRSRRERVRLAGEYLDAIQGLTTLTLARAATRRGEELRAAGERNRRAVMGLLAGNQLVILVTDGLFSLFLVVAAAGLALTRLAAGAIGLGDALALILCSFILLEPLERVGAFFYVGMGGMANQRALTRVLATARPQGPLGGSLTPQLSPPPAPQPTDDAASEDQVAQGRALQDRAAVRLDDLTAAWNTDRDVLSGVNLTIAPGEHVALVGPSGAGKSTLMSLVGGNLLPAGGQATVMGHRLTAATQDEVRAVSALVAQRTWLFCGTIADNLRLADPGADEDRLWWALEAANLAEEVRRMPDGLATAVGENGLGLSGGQAQRVSLARAFLADRPLLLLDEPTSQVDLASEAQILEAVERLSRGRTVLTVSHREGAVRQADRVLRVADGGLHETTED